MKMKPTPRWPSSSQVIVSFSLCHLKIGNSAVHISQPTVDGELDPALGLRRFGGRDAVGPGDDDEVPMAEVVGRVAHHLELADELVGRDERLARDVAAALGHDLVFEVRGRNPRTYVQVDSPLDVEQVSIAGIHVDDDRRDLEMNRGYSLLGVAHRHGELKLAQGADGAARAIRDLDR